ncbi:LysM domain protein [Ceratobasidium sp. AG-Ba]|nr:LysM domain protein [Ceratobasidium sp. AG-Ba]QRW08449.1 LysM domain protein [Ceratobasidium sp. AG-Ba]
MHTRTSTAPSSTSTYIAPYTKFNSSPAPTYDVLAPDTTYSSSVGTASARRRVGSSDDYSSMMDPWGDSSTPRASTSATVAVNGRTGLRARSKSHSKSNGGEGHPLQGSSSSASTAETRPGLRRMLSSKDSKGALWGLSDGWVEENGDEGTDTTEGVRTPGSREMLVHKIQSKDSLAGVALRYGVSLAEIRKANKLWASDSIHLRSVLYIPLTPNLKLEYNTNGNLIDLHTPNKERNLDLSSEPSSSSEPPPTPDLDVPTIQHVPATELSFFPPPTTSPRKPSNTRARTLPRGAVSPFASSSPLLFSPGLSSASPAQLFSPVGSQLSTSPSKGAGALSSIFSSIPLPDTIQRLSLDGALTPRAGSSVSDLSEQLVELNTLGARQPSTARPKRTIRTQPAPGPVMAVPKRSVEQGDSTTGLAEEDW